MALTTVQKHLRDGKLTASFAPWLIAGDKPMILSKWQELVGDPGWKEPDYSNNWAMELGSILETPALNWREKKTGMEITRRGEVVFHPTRPYVAATLDGYRAGDRAVLDAKWIDGHMGLDDRLAFYTPQLIVQRACVPEAEHAALVAIHGGAEPMELFANITQEYEARVWGCIDAFWRCVERLTPPVELPPVPPPPERWIKIDLDRDGHAYNWTTTMRWHLEQWAETREAFEVHGAATADVKKLLPDNCKELINGGVIVKRNRARAVTIVRKEVVKS